MTRGLIPNPATANADFDGPDEIPNPGIVVSL